MHHLDQFLDSGPDSPPGRADRAIVRAAIGLFGERGFGATSVRQIAAAAEVTPPLIAYHFGSKEGLYARCIEVVTSSIAADLIDEIEASTGFADMVRRLAAAHLGFPQLHPAAVRLLLAAAYAPEHAQPRVDFAAPWSAVLTRVAERFEAAIRSGEFTPRTGATPHTLTGHLFNLLHMAVFAECRGSGLCPRLGRDPRFTAATGDPVGDLCRQFFDGAGHLAAPDPLSRENEG